MMVKIGDVLPWEPRPPMFTPGEPRWHILRCRPLIEERASLHLRENGIKAIYPTLRRTVTLRGRKMVRKQILIPGYLFCDFPGPMNLSRVLDRDNPARLILDVVRLSDGTPAHIKVADLDRIRAIAAEEEQRQAEEKVRATVRPGDLVRLPSIIGLDGEVVEITAKGGLRVKLTLFGVERTVEVQGNVEKVA